MALSTEVGSIIKMNPTIECSSLNAYLVLRWLYLFPIICSSGCENLVFLDWVASCEPSWASFSRWASKVRSTSRPPASRHPSSKDLVAFKPLSFEVS